MHCSIALYVWPVPLVIDRYNWIVMIFESIKAIVETVMSSTDKKPEHETDQQNGKYEFEYKWYEESGCTEYNPESYGF